MASICSSITYPADLVRYSCVKHPIAVNKIDSFSITTSSCLRYHRTNSDHDKSKGNCKHRESPTKPTYDKKRR